MHDEPHLVERLRGVREGPAHVLRVQGEEPHVVNVDVMPGRSRRQHDGRPAVRGDVARHDGRHALHETEVGNLGEVERPRPAHRERQGARPEEVVGARDHAIHELACHAKLLGHPAGVAEVLG
eukprot:6075946-Pyramimonas_sp.AAC.2